MSGYQNMNLKTENKTINGINYKVYVLPKGNPPIYRGDTRLYNDFNKPKGTPVKGEDPKVDTFLKNHNFFTLFSDEAEIYGVPYQYKTKRPLFLLSIDQHSKNQDFYNNASDTIKTILEENYGWTTNKRDSDGLKDQEVADYICSLGLDGYASQPMESGGVRPNLPSEILLCDSETNVGLPVQVTTTSQKMKSHTDEYNTRFAAGRGDTKTVPGNKSRTTNIDVIPIAGFGSPGSPNVAQSMNFGSPGSPNVTRSMNFGSPGHAVRNLSSELGPEKPTTGGKRTTKKRKTKRKINKKRKTIKKRKINGHK